MTACKHRGCDKEARMALRTTRQAKSRELVTAIHFDDRSAPKAAEPYCKEHGLSLVIDLVKTFVEGND
jgi:hypothetical protein